MKRLFDIVVSIIALILLSPVIAATALAIRLTSPGPALHWSKRVGQYNSIFLMPKFRTMRTDTPQLATHLLVDGKSWVTPLGRFLRRTSLDELPQLWSVMTGTMSLVGPRPALFNQDDLVALRTAKGIDRLVPGITGWAQVNGRDDLPIPVKVGLECEYLARQSFPFDLKILWVTLVQIVAPRGITH